MFTYSRLNRETSDIRLVRFKQPDSVSPSTAPIELELRYASFDDDTHYAALSYVWGRPDTKTAAQIHFNGGAFTIGRNLHVALRQLCQNDVRSWLWVDFLCINQLDLDEKSWQVAQMRTVFSRADHVYIWLGPGSNKTDKAMDFASRVGPRALAVGVLDMWSNPQLTERVAKYLKERASSFEVRDSNDESSIAVKELSDFIFDILHEPDMRNGTIPDTGSLTNAHTDLKEDTLARGIMELMQREYWHRIWIVQEISLAQEATVLCGEKAIPLEIFDATFFTVSHCIRSGFRRLCPETRDFAYDLPANFYESIALTTRRKHRRRDMISIGSIVFQNGVPPGRPHYSATDARNIVFGLLGVITDSGALRLRADYNMTLAEVFTGLTRAVIYDENERLVYQLDRFVPRRKGDSSFVSLPSWVPDWQEIGKRGVSAYPVNHIGAFNATAGMPTPLHPSDCSEDDAGGLLRCPGCYVDIITDVMQAPEWIQLNDWTAARIVDAEGWLASIRDFAKLGPESSPGEDTLEAKPINDEKASVIRKIMRRVPIVLETLTEAQKEYVRELIDPTGIQSNFENLDKKFESVVTTWIRVIGSINRGRTLFKTRKDMFGLGHVAVRPGDIVSLLWGQRSPSILRHRSDQDGDGFMFVGDAYVDGIMYGEFLKTLPAHEDIETY